MPINVYVSIERESDRHRSCLTIASGRIEKFRDVLDNSLREHLSRRRRPELREKQRSLTIRGAW